MSIRQLAPAAQGQPCLAEQLTTLHGVLDGMLAASIDPSDAGCLGEVSRARARLDALRLRVIGAAEAGDVAAGEGQESTADWVRKNTRSTGAESARDARLARDLDQAGRDTGSPEGPSRTQTLSATRAALEAGHISAEHARVITDALKRLPSGISDTDRGRCETRLLEQARHLDPAQLRRVARRVLAEIEPDPVVVDAAEDAQVVDEEDHAYATARLTFHDNQDGTTTGRFTLPSLQADILRKIINAMTAPRRTNGRDTRRAHATRTGSQTESNPFERDRVDPDHARGLALAQLLEHLPTDHLTGAAATQVTVLMDIETLRGQLKSAGLDTDRPISAGEARRMACNSGLTPLVTGKTLSGKSLVLDLGRTSRLFNDTQRKATLALHTHCAARGCTRPIAWCELHHRTAWCELHHRTAWSLGGRTDLHEAVPLCGWHHRRIHDHRYTHAYEVDGSVTMSRRV